MEIKWIALTFIGVAFAVSVGGGISSYSKSQIEIAKITSNCGDVVRDE